MQLAGFPPPYCCPTARRYTPAILPVWVDEATFKTAAALTTCADKRLSAAQRTACLACLSITSRSKCLAQVGSLQGWALGVDAAP